jgi:hypothetical protein
MSTFNVIIILFAILILFVFVSKANNVESFTQLSVNDSGLVMVDNKVCRTQNIKKEEVRVVPAIIKMDAKYKQVFKNIREYDSSNIYKCIGGMDPLLSKHR